MNVFGSSMRPHATSRRLPFHLFRFLSYLTMCGFNEEVFFCLTLLDTRQRII